MFTIRYWRSFGLKSFGRKVSQCTLIPNDGSSDATSFVVNFHAFLQNRGKRKRDTKSLLLSKNVISYLRN